MKKLLQQALDALEQASPFINTVTTACKGDKCRESWCSSCNTEDEAEIAAQAGYESFVEAGKTIVALRAAIEQPESEPVAWMTPDGMHAMPADEKDAWLESKRMLEVVTDYSIPLYAAPVQPDYVPLSDGEIQSIAYDCNALPEVITDTTLLVFAKAIERAARGGE